MAKEIRYNPSFSVKKNAKNNGVSEATIRHYIRKNAIDRRFDKKIAIIEECRKYLKKHPNCTKRELCKKTGHSASTIHQYREYIFTEKEYSDFDKQKVQKRMLRQRNNFYATHPSCTWDILREEKFGNKILEPFCGSGSMAEVIKESGREVDAYDIVDRGYGEIADFFKTDFPKGKYDIITNPPYDEALITIIKKLLGIYKNKVALLLPIIYLNGKERYDEIYSQTPPARVYFYTGRITIAKNADFEKYNYSGANMTLYAWFIWERGHKGGTELRWIHNDIGETSKKSEQPKVSEVRILDNIPFNPLEEFHIPVSECIQFHSKALPENKVMSNHYDCIITFRGVEFYAVEQLYWALLYSDSPNLVVKIMKCTSGTKAKNVGEDSRDKLDWDYDEKQWRVIALCHLYKYLSVKEYRDRLRETYPQTLVECPNGKDYEYGLVQNLDTNVFEGHNCSGRTTMIVRDMMKALEDEAVQNERERLGRELTEYEREKVYNKVYVKVRNQFDNDKQIIKDSKPLFTILDKYNIPKTKKRKPSPISVPKIDFKSKCLVTDFDSTLFDTSVDDAYRKCKGKKDMDKAFELIPQYKLYEGWNEVFKWAKENKVKIAILSAASKKLIEATLKHFKIHCDTIIGYQPYIEKPNAILGNMLQEKLNIRHGQIIHIGDSRDDEIQARASQFKFFGATWAKDCDKKYFKGKKIPTISNPKEVIKFFEPLNNNLKK